MGDMGDAMTQMRIVIVDDHDVLRQGLRLLLESISGFEVVGEAADGQAGLDLCRCYQPDAALLDIQMPVMDGVTATGLIRRYCPNTQVIIFSSSAERDDVQAALSAGALSYLVKSVSLDELKLALLRAKAGQPTLASEAARVMIEAVTQTDDLGRDLSEREREVLGFIAKGLSNREIGASLYISASTVKNHVSSILAKLGTRSRAEAAALAVEHRLIRIA